MSLQLNADQILSFYQGGARSVWARASDGRSIEFPAEWLRQFVTESGVHGTFEICFDDKNRMVSMRRYDPNANVDRLV